MCVFDSSMSLGIARTLGFGLCAICSGSKSVRLASLPKDLFYFRRTRGAFEIRGERLLSRVDGLGSGVWQYRGKGWSMESTVIYENRAVCWWRSVAMRLTNLVLTLRWAGSAGFSRDWHQKALVFCCVISNHSFSLYLATCSGGNWGGWVLALSGLAVFHCCAFPGCCVYCFIFLYLSGAWRRSTCWRTLKQIEL